MVPLGPASTKTYFPVTVERSANTSGYGGCKNRQRRIDVLNHINDLRALHFGASACFGGAILRPIETMRTIADE
jgi:hypothetical protein